MNTKSPNQILELALSNVSSAFRKKLVTAYVEIKKNSLEQKHDAAGLATGKFCEIALRLLQERVFGNYVPFGTRIQNFADECRKLVSAPSSSGNESERAVIPRALVFLYTMRNKRGIGHVGGDVDANKIDIATMARLADWVICELIRINHGLSLEEAQDIVDGLSIRQVPAIWEVSGKKRVIKAGIEAKDQALLLLYSSADSAVLIEDLCDWIEYANPTRFKDIIKKLHKDRLLEFDQETESITLSPKGAVYVEEKLI